jgi:hypothetical protein
MVQDNLLVMSSFFLDSLTLEDGIPKQHRFHLHHGRGLKSWRNIHIEAPCLCQILVSHFCFSIKRFLIIEGTCTFAYVFDMGETFE